MGIIPTLYNVLCSHVSWNCGISYYPDIVKNAIALPLAYILQVALEMLGWTHPGVHFLQSGKLLYAVPTDHLWAKRVNSLRFQPLRGLVAVFTKVTEGVTSGTYLK